MPILGVDVATGSTLANVIALPLPTGAALEGGNLATLAQIQTGNIQNLLRQILIELRINNHLLQSGLNVTDDLNNLRNDPSFSITD